MNTTTLFQLKRLLNAFLLLFMYKFKGVDIFFTYMYTTQESVLPSEIRSEHPDTLQPIVLSCLHLPSTEDDDYSILGPVPLLSHFCLSVVYRGWKRALIVWNCSYAQIVSHDIGVLSRVLCHSKRCFWLLSHFYHQPCVYLNAPYWPLRTPDTDIYFVPKYMCRPIHTHISNSFFTVSSDARFKRHGPKSKVRRIIQVPLGRPRPSGGSGLTQASLWVFSLALVYFKN